MLGDTTLSRLAKSSFFIASDTLYKPTDLETNIQFVSGQPIHFKPVGRLDEVERFDLEDRCKSGVDEMRAELRGNVFSELNLLHTETAPISGYDALLFELVGYILIRCLPAMYRGSLPKDHKLSEAEKRSSVHWVFEKLKQKYGSAPDTISLSQLVQKERKLIPAPDLEPLHRTLRYDEHEKVSIQQIFPHLVGSSLLSRTFNGCPYLGHEGHIYRLARKWFFAEPYLQASEDNLKPVHPIDFEEIHRPYLQILERQLQLQLLDELDSQSDKNVPNPEWYIHKVIKDGYFEWDNVGFFIVRFIKDNPTCFLYRRIMKFAVVDPGQRDHCFPFGETRVGLEIIHDPPNCISLLPSPVTLDRINHPAEAYCHMWGFRGICNDDHFRGDIPNLISEGIATLRHSIHRYNVDRFRRDCSMLTVTEAVRQGYEIFGMRT